MNLVLSIFLLTSDKFKKATIVIICFTNFPSTKQSLSLHMHKMPAGSVCWVLTYKLLAQHVFFFPEECLYPAWNRVYYSCSCLSHQCTYMLTVLLSQEKHAMENSRARFSLFLSLNTNLTLRHIFLQFTKIRKKS